MHYYPYWTESNWIASLKTCVLSAYVKNYFAVFPSVTEYFTNFLYCYLKQCWNSSPKYFSKNFLKIHEKKPAMESRFCSKVASILRRFSTKNLPYKFPKIFIKITVA